MRNTGNHIRVVGLPLRWGWHSRLHGVLRRTTITRTLYFAGGLYEVRTDAAYAEIDVLKYYAIAGMTVAMNDGDGMQYLLTDHLGSVAAITGADGALLAQQRYKPFGESPATLSPSPFHPLPKPTSAIRASANVEDLYLMDYKARFYDSYLNRFIQPDFIVPNAADAQGLNRYSYARNNPLYYVDTSGHFGIPVIAAAVVVCVMVVAAVEGLRYLAYARYHRHGTSTSSNRKATDDVLDSR